MVSEWGPTQLTEEPPEGPATPSESLLMQGHQSTSVHVTFLAQIYKILRWADQEPHGVTTWRVTYPGAHCWVVCSLYHITSHVTLGVYQYL